MEYFLNWLETNFVEAEVEAPEVVVLEDKDEDFLKEDKKEKQESEIDKTIQIMDDIKFYENSEQSPEELAETEKIGRASCRERV
jgi:hypothetical protein